MQNSKSLIEVQSQLDSSMLPLNELPELAALRDQSGLRCVMEVSVKELTDDMVLLSVLPQIHVGANTTRFSISGSMEQLASAAEHRTAVRPAVHGSAAYRRHRRHRSTAI